MKLTRRECALRLEALRLMTPDDLRCLLDVEAAEAGERARERGVGDALGELMARPRAAQHPLVRRLAEAVGRRGADGLARSLDAELEGGDWLLWCDGGAYVVAGDERGTTDETVSDEARAIFGPLLDAFPVVHGNAAAARLEAGAPRMAVSGTRHPTDAGRGLARSLGEAAAQAGVVLVHGGAAGIDAAAAHGCREAGGRQLLVLGGGLEHARGRHPLREMFHGEESREGLRRHGPGRDAAIGFYAPFEPPHAHTLLARNEAIARLGGALVAVEVRGPEGGTYRAIDFALAAGRQVWTFARGDDGDALDAPATPIDQAARSERLLRLAGAQPLAADWAERLETLLGSVPAAAGLVARHEEQSDLFA